MRKRPLYTAQDASGVQKLRRVLDGTRWTFEHQLPFRAVLDPGVDDLSSPERRRYREGVFPFVLYPEEGTGHDPALAIELVPSGPLSELFASDAIVSARFCHQAELPLLRLGMDALVPVEQATVFEWVVSRIVAWAHEGEQRREDAQEQMRAAVEAWPNMPEEAVEDVISTYDPYFSFDIDHPFPGLAVIAKRLRARFGIRVLPGWFAYEDAGEDAPYELEFGREEGGPQRTLIGEYDARTAHAVLRARIGDDTRTLADVTGMAKFATAHLILPPGRASEVLDAAYAAGHPDDFWGIASGRMEIFDFPWLGGIMPSDVVRDVAQYRAMVGAESWAEHNLPLRRSEIAV